MDGINGNEGFDPCECINMLQMNHERAMNRLTDLLRNAQTTCTDTECFTGSLLGSPTTGGQTDMTRFYLMMAIWIAIAFLLFLFRPRSLRTHRVDPSKPNHRNTRHDPPPGPEIQ